MKKSDDLKSFPTVLILAVNCVAFNEKKVKLLFSFDCNRCFHVIKARSIIIKMEYSNSWPSFSQEDSDMKWRDYLMVFYRLESVGEKETFSVWKETKGRTSIRGFIHKRCVVGWSHSILSAEAVVVSHFSSLQYRNCSFFPPIPDAVHKLTFAHRQTHGLSEARSAFL